ncbi:MAG: hypothetical protein GY751_22225, partial [Bacteroidetes bacterium]|nr:hypothetical protein [Bacteroidota bacterium]
MRTTEDDGRIHRVYNYSTTEKRRINWKRYAAKRDDFLKEFWYYEYDILPYNTSITTTNILTGKLFETSEMAYDLDTMRMISEKSTRTADNYRSSEFEYDKWGNRIYSKDYNQVLDEKTGKFRKNETETWSHFLNGETDRFENDNLKAYPYSDSGLTNAGTRNLPLQTLVKNNIPNEDGTYSSQYINTAWEYNSLGQRTGQREWIDGVPSSTSFEYDSYGNVNKITNPLGHITTFDYNYSPDPVKYPDSYTITKTEKDVVFAADETVFPTDPAILTNSENRDNYTADIVLTSVIENRTGWMILDINPEGNETSYKYDLLGRTVETEFEDSITTIEFDDTELKTTVTKVTGVDPETNVKEGSVSVYDYDTLGRLVSVAKDVREITGIFKRGEDQSVYTLGYDNWGNVTSLKDPNQNTTTYEYDGMNRLKKVVHPAEDGVIYTREMDFDYRTNTQRVENEEGQVSYEFYDYSGRLIKHSRRWELEDIETFSYFDGLGNEVRRIDENGNSTTIEYNERNQPVETILPEEEFFENYVPVSLKPYSRTKYNLAGQKTSDIISTPDSRYADNATDTEYEYGITYEYDGLGRVISTSKPFFRNLVDDEVDDEVLTYIKEYSFYNGNGNVIKTIDGNGKESRFTYTNRGQVLSEINPEDGIVSYTYDLKDRKLSMTDSRGNSLKYPDKDFNIIYHYDDLDRLIGAQLPKSISSPNDKPVVKFTYDIKGNVLEQVNPDGGVTSFSYSPRNNKLTETVSGQTLGGVDREYTNRFTYDGLKNVKTVTDAGGNVTTNYYDLLGRLTDVSRPEGNNEYYKYDKVGNVVLTGDGKGNETESEYDAYNRVKKIIDAANGETEIKYDRLGNQTRYIDAKDNATNYVYDELNRIISETNARNEIHSFTYDSVGNIITHTDPMGTVATYTYTDLYLQDSLVLKNADESITKTITNGWDEAGDIIWSDDDGIKIYYNGYDGTEGSYSPDPYSRVMDITRVIDGKNITTGYKYDVMNRVKALVYPSGRTVEYKYNNLSQLEEVPGYIDDTIEYDSRGFLTEYMNNAGITATFDYDASSRQTDISYENSSDDILKSFNFDYDTANNISRKNNSNYTYDVLNRMKTSNESGKFAVDVEKRKLENPEYSQKIGVAEFDIAGQKSMDFETDKVELLFDYASTSIGVDLGYDTYVSHLKIKPESIGHRIDNTNLEVFISSSNFDGGYEKLTDWIMEEEENVITITFREPVFGNYIKIHSQFDERDDENNAVDLATIRNSRRELLTVFYMANIQNGEFEYDSKGNRTSSSSETMLYTTLEESDGKTYIYYPDSDRLKTVESTIVPDEKTAYIWNSNGNMTEKGSDYTIVDGLPVLEKTGDYTRYEYDLLNRLIQVSKIDENDKLSIVASYTYDSKGYRIKKVGKDSTEYFAFSLDGLLLREENIEDPGLTTEYIYAFNKVIAERRGNEDFFYLTDHLGSTVMLTDIDGNVVWQNDFTPFGEETGESGYLKRTGMYTSKKIDPDTGLYYFNARWYDASLGKFITEDPVKDGVNWY